MFVELSTYENRATAKVLRAVGQLYSDNPSDWEAAKSNLLDAMKDSPQLSVTDYDLAIYFVKKKNYSNAMKHLYAARSKGDFQTPGDIDFFKNDRDFDPLRKEASHDIAIQLEALLKID
jgi:hypothetical protein